jgi:hypothetical protein
MSLTAKSELSAGRVTATVEMPSRQAPAKALLRLRLPAGYTLGGVKVNGEAAKLADPETIDLTGRTGRVTIVAEVRR